MSSTNRGGEFEYAPNKTKIVQHARVSSPPSLPKGLAEAPCEEWLGGWLWEREPPVSEPITAPGSAVGRSCRRT